MQDQTDTSSDANDAVGQPPQEVKPQESLPQPSELKPPPSSIDKDSSTDMSRSTPAVISPISENVKPETDVPVKNGDTEVPDTFRMVPDDLNTKPEAEMDNLKRPESPTPSVEPVNTNYSAPVENIAANSTDSSGPAVSVFPLSSSKSSMLRSTKAYLVEYLLSLVMTGTLVGVAISFFNSIVNSIGANSAGSGWLSSFAYTSSLVTLSTALVFMAGLVFVSRRTRSSEAESPDIKDNRWRKGFLAVFLVLTALSTLGAAVSLVYGLVSLLASIGVTDINIGDTFKSLTVAIFSFGILVTTVALYSQDYRTGIMSPSLAKIHRYGLVIGVLVLTAFFIFMPLKGQRNSFIDGIKSRDINSIHYAVDDYVLENNELPENLGALDLGDAVEGPIDNYEYKPDQSSYELCADFKTDTNDQTSSGNPLEDVLYGASYNSASARSENPNYHDKGNQCFEFTVRINSYNSNSYREFLQQYGE